MFWESWRRNMATVATNWGNSTKEDRTKNFSKKSYVRLMSSASEHQTSPLSIGKPTKSLSQPVNLTQCTNNSTFNDDCNPSIKSSHSPLKNALLSSQTSDKESSTTASGSGKKNNVRRSFSSFLPFPVCTSFDSIVKSNQQRIINKQENQQSETTVTADQIQSPDSIKNRADCENNINEDWDDECMPACDVCSKTFYTIRQLAAHQRRKRHYGCIQCDSIFPSRDVLELHRNEMCHYEFALDMYTVDERDLNDDDIFDSDDDDQKIKQTEENKNFKDDEMDRLL